MTAWGDEEDNQRQDRRGYSAENPELLPGEHAVNQWRHGKLASRPAEHAEALGKTNGGCKEACRKSMGCQIDGAGKRKSGSRALE